MIDTGGTLCKAAEALKNVVQNVFLLITYAVFRGAAAKNLASDAIDEGSYWDMILHQEEMKAIGKVRVYALPC